MHYHLLHSVLGVTWLIKVHVLGLFVLTIRRLNPVRSFTLPCAYWDMFFLPLRRCCTADVQNGRHELRWIILLMESIILEHGRNSGREKTDGNREERLLEDHNPSNPVVSVQANAAVTCSGDICRLTGRVLTDGSVFLSTLVYSLLRTVLLKLMFYTKPHVWTEGSTAHLLNFTDWEKDFKKAAYGPRETLDLQHEHIYIEITATFGMKQINSFFSKEEIKNIKNVWGTEPVGK